ncbi:MAG: hypothetical protein WAM60_14970 [Candidatus Promineifilaceae bacterium]
MERFYVFIIHNDIWIYFLCGLALIWYFFQFFQARRLLRRAMFGLEQERGKLIQRTALSAIFFFLLVVGSVTYVNIKIAPTLPVGILYPSTPTPNIFATPFPLTTPRTVPDSQRTPTLVVAPTVTLRSQGNSTIFTEETLTAPTGTPVPTLPPVTEACNSSVSITSPPTGITADGPVTFFGTATDSDFGRYDLQAIGPETEGEWLSLLDVPSTSPIQDNILGQFNFANWLSGDYVVRVLVTNPAGEEVGQCGIQITVNGT